MCVCLCERQSMHTCTSRELIFLRDSFFAYSAQVCVQTYVHGLRHDSTRKYAHGLTIAREQTEQRDKIHTLDDDKRCWAPERQNSTQQYYNITTDWLILVGVSSWCQTHSHLCVRTWHCYYYYYLHTNFPGSTSIWHILTCIVLTWHHLSDYATCFLLIM